MWETKYAREPIDYRLFFLKLLKKIWVFPLAAIIGALVVGGVYCLVNFGIKDGYKYRARTIYYVTYADDATGKEYDYYNYFTWQEVMHTDYFTEGLSKAMGGSLSKDEIIANTLATVESDVRYLYTKSTAGSVDEAIKLEREVEKLMLAFPEGKKEIESIVIVDEPGEDDTEDVSLIFVKRAVIFGAVIGLIAAVIMSVFYACVDTSVYLPSTLEKRYGILSLGAVSMKEFGANVREFLGDKKKVAIIKADGTPANIRQVYSGEEGDVSLDIRSMKKLISHSGEDSVIDALSGDYEKVIFEDIFSDKTEEDVYKKIKECDAAVIMAKAGAHNGKKIERLLEQLSRQDIKPVAFALAGEDEWLIRSYYGK